MDIGSLGVYVCLFLALYFEVFLLITFFEKQPSKKTTLLPKRYPSISMVVPCFNEGKTLRATITSLLLMEYPKEKLEILVIDDGSTDDTGIIGQEMARLHPENVSYFYKENGGKYTALNFAIERSQSELIGCLDADSFAERDALIEVIKRFEEDEEIMAIVPTMKVHNAKSPLEVMQMAEYTFGIFVKKMLDNLGAISVLPGPFSIYKREVFSKVGIFRHAHNTEDMEIAFRIQKHGLKIVNAHNAFVYTTVPKSIMALVKQRTRWTQGFLQNAQDYWYMFLNPRFGNFGLLVLPLGMALFFGALYMTGYLLFKLVETVVLKVTGIVATGIVPELKPEIPSFDLLYFNVNVTTFLIMATFAATLASIMIGRNISKANFGIGSILSYFFIYGLIAPFWLVRAFVGAALAKESSWR
ncbi:MAG: glycosyltransferase [Patescibacteria group bacterium]